MKFLQILTRYYCSAISPTPLSAQYLSACREIRFNRIRTEMRDYLVNLKQDPHTNQCFFKFSEENKSKGKRTNMFFGSGVDSDMFMNSLTSAKENRKSEEVFASWTSKSFPNRSMTMQRIQDKYILITEEDLITGKTKKIHLNFQLIDNVVQCLKFQQMPRHTFGMIFTMNSVSFYVDKLRYYTSAWVHLLLDASSFF